MAHINCSREFTFSTHFHSTSISNPHTCNKRQLEVKNSLLFLYFCLQNTSTYVQNRTCFQRPIYFVKRMFYRQFITMSLILFKTIICYISSQKKLFLGNCCKMHLFSEYVPFTVKPI